MDKVKEFVKKHKIISIIIVLFIIGGIGNALGGGESSSTDTAAKSTTHTKNSTVENKENKPAPVKQQEQEIPKQRQVSGKATDLGTGTFAGGKDVQAGLYDVTPLEGQGNFTVKSNSGDLNVNEILGKNMDMGVSKVRTKISIGDEIQLQSINKVHFEPVTSPFVTLKQPTQLYSGMWVVGEDIVNGRYTATPGSGNGNFIVYGKSGLPKANEILGDSGVKQVTVNLDDGDIIMVSNLNQVTLTPSN